MTPRRTPGDTDTSSITVARVPTSPGAREQARESRSDPATGKCKGQDK